MSFRHLIYNAYAWWGRLESNRLPRRYEHPALTDELRPQYISLRLITRTTDIIAYYHLLGYNIFEIL